MTAQFISRCCLLFLAAIAGVLGIAGVAAPARGTVMTEAQAERIGTDAYVYGIPLMEFLRQARAQTSVTVPDSLSDAPLNRLGSARRLATPRNQVIVQPNNDTLYTMGHVDLSPGPLVLRVPKVPHHRYYSFEFLDPYTNVFAYVGTRTTGDGAGTFVITGPRFRGSLPPGLRRIRSPYDRAWLVGRTLVDGTRDLSAVRKIQNGYRLIPLTDYVKFGLSWRPRRPTRIVTKAKTYTEPKGVAFFDALGTALAENRPPPRDWAILTELRAVGIGPGLHPSKEHLSAAVLSGLAAAANGGPAHVDSLRESIATQSVLANDGWFVPAPDIADYGTDYNLRAVVALNGIAANRPAEAMYIVGVTDSTHTLLDGGHDYVLHFPAGRPPPARYFWSLTMYSQTFFLVSNPINRYELASHTAGLKYNADGSLDIYIQHAAPPGHESNWLPAPTGQFEVTLRLYGPLPSALKRQYVYPPLLRTS